MKNKNDMKGQALIILLVFTVIATTVTTGAVAVIISSTKTTTAVEQGLIASQSAESGAENALIRLLRDPLYTGETVPMNSGNVSVTVTGSSLLTITAEAKVGNFIRTVQVLATYTDNILTVTSWKEIF